MGMMIVVRGKAYRSEEGRAQRLALQLPFCFDVGALSGSLVSPSPE